MIFSIAILFSYACLISILYIAAYRCKLKSFNSQSELTILIPFRNEEKRLEALIASLNRADLDGIVLDLIFIDDHSTDDSVQFIDEHIQLDYQIISSNIEGKKAALEQGVAMAKFEYVLTLDADVFFEALYFKNVLAQIDNQDCIILPVRCIAHKNSLMQHLDVLEFKSLQTATFGSAGLGQPILSNGANLLFKRSAFNKVNGYAGSYDTNTGDDQFLVAKFNQAEMKIDAVQSAKVMVTTFAETSFFEFMKQRIRWSSKTFAIKSFWSFFNGGLIATINLAVLVWVVLLPISSLRLVFLGCLMLKLILDYCLILQKRSQYELDKSVYYIPLLSITYPIYMLVLVPLSIFFNPKWKGRKVKK